MEKSHITTRIIAVSALIGGVYAALTVAFAPISYGPVQFRISEVFCILPYFLPETAFGLYVGCILANLFTGNIFDIIFGSLATLFAGLLTARIGKREHTLANSALACFMPVIFNAVIVGAVLTWAYGIQEFADNAVLSFAVNAGWVGFGELVVLYVLGLPLIRWLPKQKFFTDFMQKLMESENNGGEKDNDTAEENYKQE